MSEIIERHIEENNLGLKRTLDLMSNGTVVIRGFSQDLYVEKEDDKITSIELQGGDYFDTETKIIFDKKAVKFTDFEIVEDDFSKLYSVVNIVCTCTSVPKDEVKQIKGEMEIASAEDESIKSEIQEPTMEQKNIDELTPDEIIEMNEKEPGFFKKIMKNFT